ncbi:MAG: hypothetical protein ACLQGP_15375 [Isosphaeraceae bacterium]
MPELTNSEVDLAERALGVKLPGLYRKLLVELGPGRIGSSAELYHPLEIRGLYEPFFDDSGQLFHPYFPFGCDDGKQEIWVIDSATERAASIWHETVPEAWPDQEWLEYEEWVIRHLDEADDA